MALQVVLQVVISRSPRGDRGGLATVSLQRYFHRQAAIFVEFRRDGIWVSQLGQGVLFDEFGVYAAFRSHPLGSYDQLVVLHDAHVEIPSAVVGPRVHQDLQTLLTGGQCADLVDERLGRLAALLVQRVHREVVEQRYLYLHHAALAEEGPHLLFICVPWQLYLLGEGAGHVPNRALVLGRHDHLVTDCVHVHVDGLRWELTDVHVSLEDGVSRACVHVAVGTLRFR